MSITSPEDEITRVFYLACRSRLDITVAHRGHYIKKVNRILNSAPYTIKKMLMQIKNVAANKKKLLQIKKSLQIKKVVIN